VVSMRMNKYAQVYTVPGGWTKVYGMRTKGEAHLTLDEVFRDIGVPN
jgi:hypothetical protein